MFRFFTSSVYAPDDWVIQFFPKDLYLSEVVYSGVIKEPIIKELLWETEKTQLLDDGRLLNKYNEVMSWSDLCNGLKTVMNQYYLCNGFNDTGVKMAVDLSKCGENTIMFMLKHEEFFSQVPMLMNYDGLEVEGYLENYKYNSGEAPVFNVNGVLMDAWFFDDFLMSYFHGSDSGWDLCKKIHPEYEVLMQKDYRPPKEFFEIDARLYNGL